MSNRIDPLDRGKKGPKVMKSMELERGANGGVSIMHRFENDGPGYHEPETHPFGADEGAKVIAHVVHHMGLKMPAAAKEPDGDEK